MSTPSTLRPLAAELRLDPEPSAASGREGVLLRLLLVEDDRDYAFLVTRRLRGGLLEGAEVHHVDTMADARAHLGATEVDCVLLDLSLPDARGMEGVLALREVAPATPVIVLTGNADHALPLLALGHGAQDYLEKAQATPEVLRRAVRYAVERKRQENELSRRESFNRAVLDALPAPTVVLSAMGRIVAANRAWSRSFGGSAATVAIGEHYREAADRLFGWTAASAWPGVGGVLAGAEALFELDFEVTAPGRDSEWFSLRATPLRPGEGVVVTHVPITRQKRAEAELGWLALHDQLTGIPSRRLFYERLEQALARGRRSGEDTGVLYLDLDRFKAVNDSYGHLAGDVVLRTIVARLQEELRDGDTLARLAGDELAVLPEEARSRPELRELGEQLCAAVRLPIVLEDGREVAVTASAGGAVARDVKADVLMSRADEALRRMKERGRDGVRLYSDAPTAFHPHLLSELASALATDHLRLHAQPVVRLADGAVVGHELLVRWDHPERGLLPPDHFIPEAERSGLIVPLGRWVLEQACALLRRHPTGFLSVNVSGAQLADPGLLATVHRARDEGVDLRRLTLEITETVVMRDIEASRRILQTIRELGVRIAVDDFGAGQTSLGYLHQLPVDVLKVDRSLISRLGRDTRVRLIVAAVIELARALHLDVVVEGAETVGQEQELRALGCPLGQGFIWGRPRDAEEALAAMEDETA
jgi:diguanylate cyclase (GGDEF)-like protein